jgi:hypothetical protein
MESTNRFPQSLEIASRFPDSTQADDYYALSKPGKIIIAEWKKYLTPNTGENITTTDFLAFPGGPPFGRGLP